MTTMAAPQTYDECATLFEQTMNSVSDGIHWIVPRHEQLVGIFSDTLPEWIPIIGKQNGYMLRIPVRIAMVRDAADDALVTKFAEQACIVFTRYRQRRT